MPLASQGHYEPTISLEMPVPSQGHYADSTHHFFGNACTKSGSLRFSTTRHFFRNAYTKSGSLRFSQVFHEKQLEHFHQTN